MGDVPAGAFRLARPPRPIRPCIPWQRYPLRAPRHRLCVAGRQRWGGESYPCTDRVGGRGATAAADRLRYDEALQFNPAGFASHFRPSIVTVTTKQGARFTKDLAVPKGSPPNPLTEPQLLAKFHSWTGSGLSAGRKDQVVAMVRDLESLGDVSQLMRLL